MIIGASGSGKVQLALRCVLIFLEMFLSGGN